MDSQVRHRVDIERDEMVALLRERGITDEAILKAMSVVDRREFVQPLFTNRAYEDSALPIGHQQTISQPYTVAFMSQCLGVKPGNRILEIGTGSGYQAAVLAELGARVFTIERNMALLNEARRRLDLHHYQIASKCGDGTVGWSEFAPFDGILVTAGAPDVPKPLVDQLKDQGRLVIPIGDLEVQHLHVIRKNSGAVETQRFDGFKFGPLIGKKGWK
jgi:protein-L-isoaspartate(D-aspartate) O-methyltransferase